MILRKPYAFLIKHFKLIHLILAGLFIYSAVRTYQLYEFVKYYISQGWVEGLNFTASTYIDIYIYLTIIAVIIISAIVMLLMNKKDKPTLIYIINIAGYFLILLIFIFSYVILNDMETKTLDTRIVNILKDINLASFMAQIGIALFALIRGLGFDIKKFNFGEDIAELKIEMTDSEEVEVNLTVDTDNIITSMRHKKREFKYVYQENKFIINIFAGLFVIIMGFTIYLNLMVYDKVYTENETFRAGNFNVKIVDSYITKKDNKGIIITDDNNSYLVIKLRLTNLTNDPQAFNIKSYKLVSGALIYSPTIKKYDQLFDIGYGYNGEMIPSRKTEEYILAYVIDDRSKETDMYIRYTNSISHYVGRLEANYKKIKITTNNLDNNQMVVKSVNLKEELSFDKSLLSNTKLTINSYELKDLFLFSYEYCIKKDCTTYQDIIKPQANSNYDKSVLALDLSLVLGDLIKLKEVNNNFDFISKLSTITYVLNGKTIEHKPTLYNRTPYEYKGSFVYIEVLEELTNATEISFKFNIRDKQYIYKIK